MLMSVELPLVLQALECLLGGEASHAPAERHLTEIDWVLTRGVLDAVVHQLSVAWDELGGQELARGDVDIEGDAGVLTPIGEPTLSVELRAQDRRPGLGDVAADPVGRDRADHRAHPRRRQRARAPSTRRAPTRCAAASPAQACCCAPRSAPCRCRSSACSSWPPARCWCSKTAPRTACCCSPRVCRSDAGAQGAAAPGAPSS